MTEKEQENLFQEALRHHQDDEFEAAYRSYLELVESGVESADLYSNISNVCNSQFRFEEAIEWGEKATALDPSHFNAKGNLASAYRESADYDKALATMGQMLDLAPSAEIVHNIAQVLKDNHEVDKAVTLLVKLLGEQQKFMEAYFTLSECLLLMYDWQRGWHHYQSRLMLPKRLCAFKELPRPLWNGEEAGDKSILVFWEQGYGDTVLMARYVELLKPKFKSVHFLVQPPLVELMQNALAGVEIIDTDDLKEKRRELDFDFYIPLFNLPIHFPEISPDVSPKSYLKANESDLPGPFKEGEKKVGISWRSATTTPYGKFKNIPLQKFLEKLDCLEGAQLYALQLGVDPDEMKLLEDHQIIPLEDKMGSFQKSADLVNAMDFIVSIDTALVHISGALGKKTLVMSAFSPAWVWGLEATKSLWYEEVDIYAQKSPREWDATLDEVNEACKELLN